MGVCDPRDPSTMSWCGDYEGSTVFGRGDDRAATGSAGQPSPLDMKHHGDQMESTQSLIQHQQQPDMHGKDEPQQPGMLDYQELKPAPLSGDYHPPPHHLPAPNHQPGTIHPDVNTNSPQDPNSVACAGCRGKILDRFFLQAVDLPWHVACLKCSQCGIHLEGALTCFARHGRIYCKDDYYRMFGMLRQCGGCGAGIGANELVMRARDRVYHVNCFRCDQCGIPLSKGDHFGMRSHKIFCRTHFEALEALGPDPAATGEDRDNNNAPLGGPMGETIPPGGMTPPPGNHLPPGPPSFHMDMHQHGVHPMMGKQSSPPPPSAMMGPIPPMPPMGLPPHHLPPMMPHPGGSPLLHQPRFDLPCIPDHQRLMGYPEDPSSRPMGLDGSNMASKMFPNGGTNQPGGTPTRGRPRKKRKDAAADMMSSMNSMGEMMTPDGYCVDGSGYAVDGQGGNSQARAKRVRTSFKHHQLRTMKSYFAVNHNPDAKDLKTLSQKTGLPKRVLQVWFQNARAKWRRTAQRQPGGAPGGGQDCLGSDVSQDGGKMMDPSMTQVPGMDSLDGMDMDMDMNSMDMEMTGDMKTDSSRSPSELYAELQ